jgi:hypothetical protein
MPSQGNTRHVIAHTNERNKGVIQPLIEERGCRQTINPRGREELHAPLLGLGQDRPPPALHLIQKHQHKLITLTRSLLNPRLVLVQPLGIHPGHGYREAVFSTGCDVLHGEAVVQHPLIIQSCRCICVRCRVHNVIMFLTSTREDLPVHQTIEKFIWIVLYVG